MGEADISHMLYRAGRKNIFHRHLCAPTILRLGKDAMVIVEEANRTGAKKIALARAEYILHSTVGYLLY